VGKQLDDAFEVLFCAFGGAGDCDDDRLSADTGDGTGHHGDWGLLVGQFVDNGHGGIYMV
jgi:hypothetical protein